jgi:peptide/nickel transport system substrate-binding protein
VTRRKLHPLFLSLATGSLCLAIFFQPGALGSTSGVRAGGIFRISLAPQNGLDTVDPALSFTPPGWALIDTTCAHLMTYPDKPPPEGFRVVPEVAVGLPKVSRDLRTFTFRLRRGFRFSDGTPVRASAFARAINRMLARSMNSPGAVFAHDIVGAAAVLQGKRRAASGVVARGNTLLVRFTRPAPDFPVLTTLPYFCAVPPTLPSDPGGVGAFPAAGPYHVTVYRPGERVVLRRNRYYGGKRPHHVDGFDVDLQAVDPTDMVRRIERGEADWGYNLVGVFLDPALGLEQNFGINRSRFFLNPGLTLRMFAFNMSRPLFRNNPRLRRAVNFALDRRALQAIAGGSRAGHLTDQYLPPVVPGFRDARIYPLEGPDVGRARGLARGSLRGGKAVLYTPDIPLGVVAAQLAKRQLGEIGLEVAIRPIPTHAASAAYLDLLATRGERWDLALVLWTPNLPDPSAYTNLLFDTHHIGARNLAGSVANVYEREMQRAARLVRARERRRAYGALDIRLARDAAPLAAINVLNEATFVSERVGCMVLRPALDLTAVCLK